MFAIEAMTLLVKRRAGISKSVKSALLVLGLGVLLLGGYLVLAQPAGAQVPPSASDVPNAPAVGIPPYDTPTATPTCTPAGAAMSSANTGPASDSLYGVAAVSANDVWAVGYYSGE